ncbi:putative cobalt ABC transporter ATPase [Paenibacillus terrae HPL-003]|uniref:Putative cobalt ABC transporter ATPase n=1 Tax=Paenibacillus terrae (strain HPL-003) TaxID=985665 RepID=G7VQY0_PAETH|nr:ATP-binding cassette domain-containing protein [Paenibacillus terrae]AET61239.1 putative cobalt ABC transporter ATPase [Paenibacillus terrae HPL-003]
MQIELNDVSFTYNKRRKNKPAVGPFVLEHIQLIVKSGEMLAVAGKSGSGKSTFIQLLKGFLIPSEGAVLLDGIDPHFSRGPELFDRVGFIFQYPEHQLFSATVFDDIAFGLQSANLTAAEKEAKVRRAMESVQLDFTEFKDRSPFELSGGEKRRVAIAGVIVLEPKILILDEPTAGLDLQSRTALFGLLHDLNREQGITVLWVSHQLEEILEQASRLIVLKEGRFLADGPPAKLLSDPQLLEVFGWEEPPGLAIALLLQELGAQAQDSSAVRPPQETASAIIKLWQAQQQPSLT